MLGLGKLMEVHYEPFSTETCLSTSMQNLAIQPDGFSNHQMDRTMSGQNEGGGHAS